MFIDSKIEENIINKDEDWKRYRDDSFSISLRKCEEKEIEKTKWVNESIVKDKIKFIMKRKMVFLETKIVATPITGTNFVIATGIYSKKRTLTSISTQIHVIQKIKSKLHPL